MSSSDRKKPISSLNIGQIECLRILMTQIKTLEALRVLVNDPEIHAAQVEASVMNFPGF